MVRSDPVFDFELLPEGERPPGWDDPFAPFPAGPPFRFSFGRWLKRWSALARVSIDVCFEMSWSGKAEAARAFLL